MSLFRNFSLSSLITNNPIYTNQNARIILFTIGAGVVLSKTISLLQGIFSLFPSPKDLAARYGKGSWAVVTGAGDGIGRGFCLELANRGFNIVLVGRTLEKMEAVASEIRTRHPSVQTKIVVSDFAKSYEDGFAEKIFDQVKDLDISLLVNNAGMGLGLKLYVDAPITGIKDLVLVNSLSHALILRAFLPKLSARTQRAGIINVASLSAASPLPRSQVYAASKVFVDYLSRGLTYEHPNIDILSYKPGTVQTSMIKDKRSPSEIITVEQCVHTALSALGNTDSTYGHWKHRRLHFIMTSLPEFLFKAQMRKRFRISQQAEKTA